MVRAINGSNEIGYYMGRLVSAEWNLDGKRSASSIGTVSHFSAARNPGRKWRYPHWQYVLLIRKGRAGSFLTLPSGLRLKPLMVTWHTK